MITLNHKSRPSAVSIALRTVQKDALVPTIGKTEAPHELYEITIANTKKNRQQAFELGYEVYKAKGYIPENKTKMLITATDFHASTCIINIQDKAEVVASITLNFKDNRSLPCEELYETELQSFLQNNIELVEITRLVIKENHRHSNYLLAQLFQATHIYAMQIKGVRDLVIEVNPRHVGFYQKLLGFSVIGGEKACERVNNAPAILLHLDLNYIQQNLINFYENKLDNSHNHKFFKFAMPQERAKSLKAKFNQTHRPITFAEKIYFGFQQARTPDFVGA